MPHPEPRTRLAAWCLVLAGLLWAAGVRGQALNLFPDDALQTALTAATAVGVRHPVGAVGVLTAVRGMPGGEVLPPKPTSDLPPEKAPLIEPDVLTGVMDGTKFGTANENYDEVRAYNYVLAQASKLTPAAFARAARTDLTYAHLAEEPVRHRGQVVHVEGQLRRLRRFDPPRGAAAEGVKDLYEGWLFEEALGANPYCVLSTELPAEIKLGDVLDYRVAFNGYFFKRYGYKAGDGWREAPLLIGRTLVLRGLPPAPESDWSFSRAFLPAFLGLIAATLLIAAGLGWWYRRGDRQVRARLASARLSSFPEPDFEMPDASEERAPRRGGAEPGPPHGPFP